MGFNSNPICTDRSHRSNLPYQNVRCRTPISSTSTTACCWVERWETGTCILDRDPIECFQLYVKKKKNKKTVSTLGSPFIWDMHVWALYGIKWGLWKRSTPPPQPHQPCQEQKALFDLILSLGGGRSWWADLMVMWWNARFSSSISFRENYRVVRSLMSEKSVYVVDIARPFRSFLIYSCIFRCNRLPSQLGLKGSTTPYYMVLDLLEVFQDTQPPPQRTMVSVTFPAGPTGFQAVPSQKGEPNDSFSYSHC